MQGSSAFQFGRAAYRNGLLGRRQLLADAVANIQFRLRGATDADSLALRERIAASLEGKRVVELERRLQERARASFARMSRPSSFRSIDDAPSDPVG